MRRVSERRAAPRIEDAREPRTLPMPGNDADVIDALVGITPGSALDAIRGRRPEARAHAQATYRALFTPEALRSISAQERFAVGAFVAGLHGETAVAAAYAARLAAIRNALGPRLAAALEHTHMLVFHPRDAAPASLQALLDAGWSTTDIVTLSQIVAFLSFQIRVVIGLRTLAGRP